MKTNKSPKIIVLSNCHLQYNQLSGDRVKIMELIRTPEGSRYTIRRLKKAEWIAADKCNGIPYANCPTIIEGQPMHAAGFIDCVCIQGQEAWDALPEFNTQEIRKKGFDITRLDTKFKQCDLVFNPSVDWEAQMYSQPEVQEESNDELSGEEESEEEGHGPTTSTPSKKEAQENTNKVCIQQGTSGGVWVDRDTADLVCHENFDLPSDDDWPIEEFQPTKNPDEMLLSDHDNFGCDTSKDLEDSIDFDNLASQLPPTPPRLDGLIMDPDEPIDVGALFDCDDLPGHDLDTNGYCNKCCCFPENQTCIY